MPKMPCHISDGPDYDDWLESNTQQGIDEDAAYEEFRQRKIDDGECMTCNRPHEPGDTHCAECNAIATAKCTICQTAWVDVLNGEDTCPDCLRNV